MLNCSENETICCEVSADALMSTTLELGVMSIPVLYCVKVR